MQKEAGKQQSRFAVEACSAGGFFIIKKPEISWVHFILLVFQEHFLKIKNAIQ